MLQRTPQGLPHLADQRRKTRIWFELVPQGEHVDVVANLVFQLGVDTARHRSAHHQIPLSGIPVDQGLDSSHQHSKEPDPSGLAQSDQSLAQLLPKRTVQGLAGKALNGWAHPVRG